MRFLALLVGLCLTALSVSLAQKLPQPTQNGAPAFPLKVGLPTNVRTVFTMRAVDENKQEVAAQYHVRAVLAKREFSGQSNPGSEFSFVLDRTDTLVVVSRASGFYSIEEVLVVTCDTCENYQHIALMEKDNRPDNVFYDLRVNDKIRLDNVYFDQSSYVLRPESYPQLDKLVNTLTANQGLKVEIAGHTDNVGDRRLNQLLSENRAKVISSYLVTKGVPKSRLVFQGYGGSRPAAPNDTEANKKLNRRVEFVVLAK